MMKQQDSVSDNVKAYDFFAKEEGKFLMISSRKRNNKTVLKRHGPHETK